MLVLYIKAIPESSKLVSFPLSEDVNVQYALEFNTAGTALRRFATKIDHPIIRVQEPDACSFNRNLPRRTV